MSNKNAVMTVVPKAPKPTLTQAEALADAVLRAYRDGWNGDLGHKQKPFLERGGVYRVGVPTPTKNALVSKDLVRRVEGAVPGRGATYFLTRAGVEAGTKRFTDRQGVSPAEFVKKERQAVEKRNREREKRIKDVQHLFRGLKIERSKGGGKAMASHIDGGEVRLFLDDLEVLGKGIERLRQRAKKAA